MDYGREAVLRRLHEVGCAVTEGREPAAGGPAAVLAAGPALPVGPGRGGHPAGGLREHPGPDAAGHGRPRPDRPAAAAPADRPRAGRGRLRRGAQPAVQLGAADHDRLQLPPDDPRRRAPRLANPLNDDEPLLRTTLLPGLLRVLARNVGRGFGDVGAVRERPGVPAPPGGPRVAPDPAGGPRADGRGGGRAGRGAARPAAARRGRADRRPGAGRLVGRGPAGGLAGRHRGRPGGAAEPGVSFGRADQAAPWHPGRCAALFVAGRGQGAGRARR